MENEEVIAQSSPPPQTPDTTKSATEQAFIDFQEKIVKEDIPDAESKVKISYSDYRSKQLARWKRKCVLQRQEETLSVYQSLNESIGVFAQKDAGEIRKKIDSSTDANKKNVAAKLAETTTAIKNARTKLEALKKKGEELETAANSHAMSADLAAIIKIVGKKEDTLAKFTDLKTSSADAYEKADDAAEVVIKVSGIHASANVDSLKALGVDIEKSATELQADLAKNIKDSNTAVGTTREDYQKNMQQLVEAKYAWYNAKLTLFGICDTQEQVKKPDCPAGQDIAKELDNLQLELEKNFKTASTFVASAA